MIMKSNLIKVKVYPKDLKSIPDILPYNKLLHGDPVELELNKNEIHRCMNFGDVFDLTSGEEVLIDENSFKEIVEFVEDTKKEDNVTDKNESGESQVESESIQTRQSRSVPPVSTKTKKQTNSQSESE